MVDKPAPAKKTSRKAPARKAAKPAKPAPAPDAPPAAPAATPAVAPKPAPPPAPPPSEGPELVAWIALCLAIVPVAIELFYLAFSDRRFDGPDFFFVPVAAILMPATGAILAAVVLGGHRNAPLRDGAHQAAVVALVLGIAVFATWGLWVLLTAIALATCQPSPQPCNVTCQASSDAPRHGCCDGCPSGPCCGGSSSSGGGGSCCGSSSGSGGGGSCCGSSSSGGGGGSCGCGGSSSGSGGGSLGSPGEGAVGAVASVGSALALRACNADRWAHHPDTPRYRNDVYRIAGQRFCVGCTTTFPVFIAVAAGLRLAGLPVAWPVALATGLCLASLQAVSAAGWARARWQKAAVKASLGAGLALAVVAVMAAPWPPLGRGLALLAMAGLAYASTIPRRRRMAAEANTGTHGDHGT